MEKHKDAAECVKKEAFIHRLLVHPNIIRYFGQRKENLREYIFLEYASGGELFNKIGKQCAKVYYIYISLPSNLHATCIWTSIPTNTINFILQN